MKDLKKDDPPTVALVSVLFVMVGGEPVFLVEISDLLCLFCSFVSCIACRISPRGARLLK